MVDKSQEHGKVLLNTQVKINEEKGKEPFDFVFKFTQK